VARIGDATRPAPISTTIASLLVDYVPLDTASMAVRSEIDENVATRVWAA
jgi:hypothetical protein